MRLIKRTPQQQRDHTERKKLLMQVLAVAVEDRDGAAIRELQADRELVKLINFMKG